MLVLSRKTTQTILIGDDIRITVIRVGKSTTGDPLVRIGIEAPTDLRVDRSEVRDRILAAAEAETN